MHSKISAALPCVVEAFEIETGWQIVEKAGLVFSKIFIATWVKKPSAAALKILKTKNFK